MISTSQKDDSDDDDDDLYLQLQTVNNQTVLLFDAMTPVVYSLSQITYFLDYKYINNPRFVEVSAIAK